VRRFVIDTNVLVSAALFADSTPHRALVKARAEAILLASEETIAEFRAVLLLDKFDKYVARALREGVIEEYTRQCAVIPIHSRIRICRDPRDDKFIEAAVHGLAHAVVTGDRDLLALDPFQGIRILTPASFLAF
jgi:putative PIN family toxin of toxin-antitoxin system